MGFKVGDGVRLRNTDTFGKIAKIRDADERSDFHKNYIYFVKWDHGLLAGPFSLHNLVSTDTPDQIFKDCLK